MKNKNFSTIVLLCWFSVFLLFSISKASASPLEGVWDNYTLGTHGEWQLLYQNTTDFVSTTIDFDGDFLGNGSDPDALTLTGPKNAEGLASISASNHASFGDVAGSIDQDGNIFLLATNFPDTDIKSMNLTGVISATDFTFSHDIEFESGEVTYGVTTTLVIFDDPITISSPSEVPLPASIWLLISSLGVLFSFGRRDRKQAT